ncbi:hypothetical protein D4R08_07880 [Corynebacterium xerosis]|uniref:hypothetical protein n=1 Tax=Corynebacterium xerosis TaxID=1725 RepID=UPI000EAE1EBF|nr:hypothetical protein [Corynebacterium xerosis]AYJ33226.1 hypothetical protein D4R08_07880 [Corynebacterium xerosis]
MFRRSALAAVSATAILSLSACGILGGGSEDSSESTESPTAASSQSSGKDGSLAFEDLIRLGKFKSESTFGIHDLKDAGYSGSNLRAGKLPAEMRHKYPWRVGLVDNGQVPVPAKNAFRVWWGCEDYADSIDIISSTPNTHGIEFPDLQGAGYPYSMIAEGNQNILMTMNGAVDTDNLCEYAEEGNYPWGWNLKVAPLLINQFIDKFPR